MLRWLRKAVLAAVLASGAAAAHNYHMGLADIGYNADTGNTEIVHTYTAHDVEALLTKLHGRQFDLGLAQDQEALRRYLDQHFVLTANGRRLPLQWVGVKASADTITVFQELVGRTLPAGAVLKNGVLTDLLPNQINTVNVGGSTGRAAATLTFTAARSEQRLP